jgi:hypothetical protein
MRPPAVELRIVSLLELEIEKLNDLRNRLAHAGRNLIEHKGQCDDLIWAKKMYEARKGDRLLFG